MKKEQLYRKIVARDEAYMKHADFTEPSEEEKKLAVAAREKTAMWLREHGIIK